MKKLLVILMMAFVVGCGAFAKPVTFAYEDIIITTDDENKQSDFSGRPDEEVVALAVSCMPQEIGKYRTIYAFHRIEHELTAFDETYFNYLVFKKDNTCVVLYQNLGDGRRLAVLFSMEKEESK